MAKAKTFFLVLVAFVIGALFVGQGAGQFLQVEPVSELCLGCICEAVSNCNRTLGCSGDVCGIFRITWAYWADAGKPILDGDDPNADGAYGRCTVDPVCAAKAVTGYMSKFAQDCNGDGIVNCRDYAAIHRLGGYGCSGPLDPLYGNRFKNCQEQVAALTGGNSDTVNF